MRQYQMQVSGCTPKVWLQGNQSTSTGFFLLQEAPGLAPFCCWLAHSVRCVLMTTLGVPVGPRSAGIWHVRVGRDGLVCECARRPSRVWP